jgi:hypothetical protein
MSEKKFITFDYSFVFEGKENIDFSINLDAHSLNYISDAQDVPADWALLENDKCPNCTLDATTSPYCPVCLRIHNVLLPFLNTASFEKVKVIVRSAERTYSSDTSVQKGLSSMLGIYMVTCGCPIMAYLKPMVRYHLPFASLEDTIYRAVSSYLLRQYFKHKRKEKADWDLKGLIDIYKEVQIVNEALVERFRSLTKKDASVNAIILLDIFAKELPYSIEDRLKELEYLFS